MVKKESRRGLSIRGKTALPVGQHSYPGGHNYWDLNLKLFFLPQKHQSMFVDWAVPGKAGVVYNALADPLTFWGCQGMGIKKGESRPMGGRGEDSSCIKY